MFCRFEKLLETQPGAMYFLLTYSLSRARLIQRKQQEQNPKRHHARVEKDTPRVKLPRRL